MDECIEGCVCPRYSCRPEWEVRVYKGARWVIKHIKVPHKKCREINSLQAACKVSRLSSVLWEHCTQSEH